MQMHMPFTFGSLFVQLHSTRHVSQAAPAIFFALRELVCGFWHKLITRLLKPVKALVRVSLNPSACMLTTGCISLQKMS